MTAPGFSDTPGSEDVCVCKHPRGYHCATGECWGGYCSCTGFPLPGSLDEPPPCDCRANDWVEGDNGAIRCVQCGGYAGEPGTSIRVVPVASGSLDERADKYFLCSLCNCTDSWREPNCPRGSLDERDTPQEDLGGHVNVASGTEALPPGFRDWANSAGDAFAEWRLPRHQGRAIVAALEGVSEPGGLEAASAPLSRPALPETDTPPKQGEGSQQPGSLTPSDGVLPGTPDVRSADSEILARPAGYTETDSAAHERRIAAQSALILRALEDHTACTYCQGAKASLRYVTESVAALVARLAAEEARAQEAERALKREQDDHSETLAYWSRDLASLAIAERNISERDADLDHADKWRVRARNQFVRRAAAEAALAAVDMAFGWVAANHPAVVREMPTEHYRACLTASRDVAAVGVSARYPGAVATPEAEQDLGGAGGASGTDEVKPT